MNKQSNANTVSGAEIAASHSHHHNRQSGTGFYSTLTHMVLKQKRQRLALAK
ncbi:hypothetical protein [Candidatus Thalassolituus haligoni]|uniref:hypothetical protein n=1 Tax=Candidatus Thalassolituus haligoni TaxID=3100113 RepID=UPI003514A5B5